MINQILHRALLSKFGKVVVTGEGQQRLQTYNERTRQYDVAVPGEHYQACCPFCGDTRFRLSISHTYARVGAIDENADAGRGLINCYNEGCREVTTPAFRAQILGEMQAVKMRAIAEGTVAQLHDDAGEKPATKRNVDFPSGLIPLRDLPLEHEAWQFVRRKYAGIPPTYFASFGVMWCGQPCGRYPKAYRRIIFPIYGRDGRTSWQGRTVDNEVDPRWYNPPGYDKGLLFNEQNLGPLDVPIIAEGIPSAIACGPKSVAIYSVSPAPQVLKRLAETYSTAIIALDPDAFVPDNRPGGKGAIKAERLIAKCNALFHAPVRAIRWPDDILEQARAYCSGETKAKPPDPADLGIRHMHGIIHG